MSNKLYGQDVTIAATLTKIELALRRASNKFSPYHETAAKRIVDAVADEIMHLLKDMRDAPKQ